MLTALENRWCLGVCLTLVLGMATVAQAEQPFVDPFAFDSDFQFFAPHNITDFGNGTPPNTGAFFEYDRLVISVSRDQSSFEPYESDTINGNLIEVGYMTDDEHGWFLSYIQFQEKLFSEGRSVTDLNGTVFELEDNDIGKLIGFELNRSYRLRPLHSGAIVEPYFGLKFVRFTDRFQLDNFSTPAQDTFVNVRNLGETKNEMIGGHVAVRMYRRHSRWILSSQFKMFALQNFQFFDLRNITQTFTNAAVTGIEVEDIHRNFDEFVWGGELRAEAALQMTRDISLRFGLYIFDFGQGIGRSSFSTNDQDLFAAGGSFGITVNR